MYPIALFAFACTFPVNVQGQGGPPQVYPQMIYYTAATEGNGSIGFVSGTFGKVSVTKVGGDYWVGFRAAKFDPPGNVAIYVGSGTGDVANPIIS